MFKQNIDDKSCGKAGSIKRHTFQASHLPIFHLWAGKSMRKFVPPYLGENADEIFHAGDVVILWGKLEKQRGSRIHMAG